MPESTLSLTFSQLRVEVADHLGWGRASSWDATALARLVQITNKGLRQFYYPDNGHQWSFLRLNAALTTWTSVTGTITGVSTTTITSAAPSTAFEVSMEGHVLTADTSGTAYTITAVTSGTVLTVTPDPTADNGDTYSIPWASYYTMPADFGYPDGDVTFAANESYSSLKVISEGELRRLSMVSMTSIPAFIALRPRSFDATVGQRQVMLMYPTPTQIYNLTYRYHVQADTFTAALPYHRGGAMHADTVVASCIAAADELYNEGAARQSAETFQRRLAASIARDRRLGAERFGYNNDLSDAYPLDEEARTEILRATTGSSAYQAP